MARNMANPKYKAKFQRKLKRRCEAKRAAAQAAREKPCTDCGLSFPFYVMDLDHVRGRKIANVSMMIATGKYTLDEVLTEIAKCEPVCANCHRIRTHRDHRVPPSRLHIDEPQPASLFDAL